RCRVTTMREGEAGLGGTMKVRRLVGRNVGAKAISLMAMEFGCGASPELRNRECDEVIYLLEGEGTILIEGAEYDVGPEVGVYIRPGQAFSVRNPGHESLVLISSRCPEPDSEPEIGLAGSGDLDVSVISGLANTRTGGQGCVGEHSRLLGRDPALAASRKDFTVNKVSPVVRLADRKALPTGDRWYRVLVDDEV